MGRAGWRAQLAGALHLRVQIRPGKVRSDAGCRQSSDSIPRRDEMRVQLQASFSYNRARPPRGR